MRDFIIYIYIYICSIWSRCIIHAQSNSSNRHTGITCTMYAHMPYTPYYANGIKELLFNVSVHFNGNVKFNAHLTPCDFTKLYLDYIWNIYIYIYAICTNMNLSISLLLIWLLDNLSFWGYSKNFTLSTILLNNLVGQVWNNCASEFVLTTHLIAY